MAIPSGSKADSLVKSLKRSFRAEEEATAIYRWMAERTADPQKKALLRQLGEAEERHAVKYRLRLAELGVTISDGPPPTIPVNIRFRAQIGFEQALRAIEAIEETNIAQFQNDAALYGDAETARLYKEIAEDEEHHSKLLHALASPTSEPQSRLTAILKRERHVSTGSWIGDAIYGANDGLGAVFGLVAGVAGATADNHFILVAGIAGAVASAVSMGSGAFLAAKSEREVHEAEMERERQEMVESPEEEQEELSLFYQLKGLSKDEADALAARLAQHPEQMLQALAQEELGLSAERLPNPWVSMASATLSTGLGAALPVVPFLFLDGMSAMLAAFVVSLVGHFVVGAAKSLVTIRSWWVSGLEMTAIGVIVGVVTYAVGVLVGLT